MNEKDIAPAPIGKVLVFGNPWHGVVREDVLTMPGGATKSVPTAPNDGHGGCWKFQVPGAPGLGEAVADPGEQWLDYLLYYGRGNVVYHKTVNSNLINWFCLGDDGTRWLVSVTSATSGIPSGTASLGVTFQAKRFGDIGVAAESHSFTLTLANRGLAHATETLPSTVSMGFCDANATGKKAVLMFFTPGAGEYANQRLPLAFFEVTLDPANFASSSIGLLYNTDQVSGTATGTPWLVESDTGADCDYSISVWGTPLVSDWGYMNSIMTVWYSSAGAATPIYHSHKVPLSAWSWSEYNLDTVNIPSNCDDCTGDATEFVNKKLQWDGWELPVSVNRHGVGEIVNFNVVSGSTTTLINVGSHYNRSYEWAAGFGCAIGTLQYLDLSPSAYLNIQCTSTNVPRLHPWLGPATAKPVITSPANQASAWQDDPMIFTRILSPTFIVVGLAWLESGIKKIKLIRAITKIGQFSLSNEFSGIDRQMLMGTLHPHTTEMEFADDGVPVFYV